MKLSRRKLKIGRLELSMWSNVAFDFDVDGPNFRWYLDFLWFSITLEK